MQANKSHEALSTRHGWLLAVALDLVHEIGKDRVMAVAAGVTFYTILAMVPALTALVSIFGLVSEPVDAAEFVQEASNFLPGDAAELLTEQAGRIASKADNTLSFAAMISLGLALWSANGGTRALMDALAVACDLRETRGFVQLNLISLILTFGGLAVAVILATGIAALPVVLGWIRLEGATETLILLGRWPFVAALLMTGLALLYNWGARRPGRPWRWITPGSLLATLLLILCSTGLSFYVGNFARYDETYGSLAAAAVTMIWIWLSTASVLIGAELNAVIEDMPTVDPADPR